MSRMNLSSKPRYCQLSQDLQVLQLALAACSNGQQIDRGSEPGLPDCCVHTRHSAEICLTGLRELLSEPVCGFGESQEPQCNTAQPTSRPRILVAEDNPANLALIEHQLDVLGWQADCAPDGHRALALWREKQHKLVLIDKQMPGMDGLSLARKIRSGQVADSPPVIIIGISAGNYRDEIGPARAAGMDEVLPKPFDLKDLERTLSRYLPEAHATRRGAGFGNAAILDRDHVARTTGRIDAHKLDHLIELFLSTAETELFAAPHHYRHGSSELLRRSLHKLRSAALAVGALRFAAQAEFLESQVRSGESDGVADGLEWLIRECEQIRCTAKQQLDAASPSDLLQTITVGQMPGVVWIVDTDNLAREQLALMLSAHGWGEVRTFESSEAILGAAKSLGLADLLICDINLPGMNCIELLCAFHEQGLARAVLLTGGDDEKLLSETVHLLDTLGLPLWGELRKPYTHEAFRALLSNEAKVHQLFEGKHQIIDREELLTAIHDDAFDIYYQPKVDTETLAVVGVEALARWHHKGQHVPPREFIRAAEEHGLIAPLSELLLIKALSGAAELTEAGIHLPLSINLSSNWFRSAKVPELIHACTTATGVLASNVTFELREEQILDHLENIKINLQQLRKQGFRLAVDDLEGSRSNALEQIDHLPLNELKLGHTLVSEAEGSPARRSLLASCIAMAHRLNLSLVAEGVETTGELALMREMGCDHIQGWLIARAMPIVNLIAWLKGHTS